ncbi:MAG: hypothetical protein JXA69_05445 [Phycisphaerae bacterium]|nr:hypothetical protein [Phycisphaerae bacterium]
MEQMQTRTSSTRSRCCRRRWQWIALAPLLHGCLLTAGCGELWKNSVVEGVSVFITGQVTQIDIDADSLVDLLNNLLNLIPGQGGITTV